MDVFSNFDFHDISISEREKYVQDMKQIRNELEAHIIPESYPDLVSNFNMMLISSLYPEIIRDEIIKISSYCLISKDWIRVLSSLLKGKRCLEIMSGLGMLSKALQNEEIEIVATDSKEWEFDDGFYWTEVKTMDAISAIEVYGRDMDFIICSWIPYPSDIGRKVLLKMREVNPKLKMVYIGEFGGCCADESFFALCEVEEDNHIYKANQIFKNWAGIHDHIYLLR
uniref:hypothetical protein n=1 Tax=Enterocloster aldenensis TaxID=358742 RepID=UPI0011C42A3E